MTLGVMKRHYINEGMGNVPPTAMIWSLGHLRTSIRRPAEWSGVAWKWYRGNDFNQEEIRTEVAGLCARLV